MLLPILKYPDKRLNIVASSVNEEEFKDNIHLYLVVNNMFETMENAGGIGLAATQVNIHKRIIVMKVTLPIVIINPVVISKSEKLITFREGCLSFPNVNIELERSSMIHVAYRDIDGNLLERSFSDLEAICIQHEIDHLDGITFKDRKKKNSSCIYQITKI